jgi:hypothetical protein
MGNLQGGMSDMLQLVVKIMDTPVMILPVTSHIEPCQSRGPTLFRQHINCLKSFSAFLSLFIIASSIECLNENDPRFIEFYRPQLDSDEQE